MSSATATPLPIPFPMPLLIRGDARALPLPDESVDLIVVSPPYYRLRSYTDAGVAYRGQLGSEASPTDYLDALIGATREWARVLKPSGSLFVNLGDRYATARTRHGHSAVKAYGGNAGPCTHRTPGWGGWASKSLMLLPERYRVRCVDEVGLIARAVIVWSKPNGLPESVTDRVRRCHEDWVHLTKNPRYYAAVDHIREPFRHTRAGGPGGGGYYTTLPAGARNTNLPTARPHRLGRLPGSVWTVATTPLSVPAELGIRHFAAFPPELPRRIVLAWSPREVCTACGQGRAPVADRSEKIHHGPSGAAAVGTSTQKPGKGPARMRGGVGDVRTLHRVTGYACACPDTRAPSRPAVVLDPCSGTGTTALVASMLGRHGIGIDRSADYCRLARWRCSDPTQRARAAEPRPDHRAARAHCSRGRPQHQPQDGHRAATDHRGRAA